MIPERSSWLMIAFMTVVCLAQPAGLAAQEEGDEPHGSVTVGARYAGANDDEQKFREDTGIWDGATVGIRDFNLDLPTGGWNLDMSGRFMQPGDYRAITTLTKPDVGFVKLNYDEFDTYDDSSNLFYGFPPYTYERDTDLIKTWRDASLVLGLTPPDQPNVTLTFNRWEKFGERSILHGGSVTNGQSLDRYPLFEDLDQGRNRVSLDITHTIGRFDVRFSETYQEFDGENEFTAYEFDSNGDMTQYRPKIYEPDNRSLMHNLEVAGDLIPDLLRLNLSGRYTDTETDTTYDENAFDASGNPVPYGYSYNFTENDHEGELFRSVWNARLTCTPNDVWTLFGGIGRKDERDNHTSVKNVDVPHGGYFGVDPLPPELVPDGVPNQIWRYDTDHERRYWMYNTGVQVEPLSWLTGKVEGRFERGDVTYDWNGLETLSPDASTESFYWESDADFDRDEYIASVTIKPVSQLKLIGRYKLGRVDNDYTDEMDLVNGSSAEHEYPGFIDDNSRTSREWAGIVEYRPWSTVWATYKLASQRWDFRVQQEPVEKIGESNSLINSLSLNCSPVSRLTLSAFGSHRYYEVKTEARNTAGFFAEPYEGDANTVGLNASYALTEDTSVSCGTSKTFADGEREHEFGDLYLGCSHRFDETWSADGRYTYVFFDEQDNGNIDDYSGHVFMTGLTARF